MLQMLQIEEFWFYLLFLAYRGGCGGMRYVALCVLKQTDVAISDNTTWSL